MTVIHAVVFDCADPVRVSGFWRAVPGYEYRQKQDDWCTLRHPQGAGPQLSFGTVPEGKVVKNRVHLDIRPEGRTRDEERARLKGFGATTLGLVDDNPPTSTTSWPTRKETCSASAIRRDSRTSYPSGGSGSG